MDPTTNRRLAMQSGAGLVMTGLIAQSAVAEKQAAQASKHKLKITDVKTYHLETRLKRPFGASVSVPLPKVRDALLVKIETDHNDLSE